MFKKFLTLTKKELLSYFDSPIAYIFVAIFLIVLNWLFFQDFFLLGQVSMRGYFNFLPWVLMFLLPSLAMRLLSEEKKEGTIEVLLTLPIGDWVVVVAKWLASWLLLSFVLLLSLTIPWTLSGLGNLELGPIVGGYIGSLLFAGVYLSLGLFISSITKNQIVSFIVALAIGFVWWLFGTPFVTESVTGSLAGVLQMFSPAAHWNNTTKGLIDTSDIIFYLSFIALWLYLAMATLNRRRESSKSRSLSVTVVLVLAIALAVNLVSGFAGQRFDLTENNIYTLTPVSKKVAASFDDNVIVTAYISEDLPSRFVNLRQEVEDMLSEYKRNSKGKIKIEYINPSVSSEKEQEAATYGIPKLQFNTVERDKLESLGGYFGLVFLFADKSETIPVIESSQGLEYQITSNLKKLDQQNPVRIAWLESEEVESSSPFVEAGPYAEFKKELKTQYSLVNMKSDGLNLDSSISTLVVAGLDEELNEEQLYKVDQFIMNGGSLLYLKDGVIVGDGLVTETAKSAINDLVEVYGIKVNNDLVLDKQSGQASFSSGFFQFVTQYPFWPKILGAGFDSTSIITKDLESAVLPWVSSLDIADNTSAETRAILKSTGGAWQVTGSFDLNPQQNFFSANQETGLFNLGVSVQGELTSYFSGKEKPKVEDGGVFKSSSSDSRLIVVSDSDFITDVFLRMYPANFVLGQNLVDWLAQDEDLISIRSRGVTERPIKELTDQSRSLIRYSNIFAMAILVSLLGIIRFLIKRKNG